MAQHITTRRILRIMELLQREERFKSWSAMARSLEYSSASFDKVRNDDRNLPVEVIHKFFEVYNINPIVVFDDRRWKEEYDSNDIEAFNFLYEMSNFKGNSVPLDNDHIAKIILIPNNEKENYIGSIRDNQGQNDMTRENEENFLYNERALLPGLKSNGVYRGFQVFGDEMENNLYHGDWVIARKLENFSDAFWGKIHVVVTDIGIFICRVLNIDQEKQDVYITYDNVDYQEHIHTIKTYFLQEIWTVEQSINRRFPKPIKQHIGAVQILKTSKLVESEK
ncbi:hypothetical protein [Aquimarina latercula]|uniref:hypothetical protein n=1 Tax=Aquimarina latercula TaxID=987 RepID=UPI0003FA4579|nr:hypothetical protein [Aquimarina latercula]